MNHTPEPWSVAEESFDNDGIHESVIRGLDGRAAIAVTLEFGANNPGMREANARRIVACVNACAGIETYALELMTGELLLLNQITHKTRERPTKKAVQYRKQRDKLLAALEGLAGDINSLIHESSGVAGLHLNDDLAPWHELEAGGRFERLTHLPIAIEEIEALKCSNS